ncbi:prepilin peptidase [Candidatus Bathyarchaeota archaeon]|nr:prepilin peptidase [Candidatus Bathyarchaeota archaeon]
MMIDVIRFSLSMLMLCIGSYLDFKYREISDFLWIIFGGIGLILNGYEFIINSFNLYNFAISFVFILIIGFLIYYLQILGEADIIAFITLSILNPNFFSFDIFNFYFSPLFFSLSLFSNSILISGTSVIFNSIKNFLKYLSNRSLFKDVDYSFYQKLVLFFTSTKKDFSEIKGPPFDYPMEFLDEGKRNLMIRTRLQDDDESKKIFKDLKLNGLKTIWVSSTLPFIIYITIGYFITFLIGDLMFLILFNIF